MDHILTRLNRTFQLELQVLRRSRIFQRPSYIDTVTLNISNWVPSLAKKTKQPTPAGVPKMGCAVHIFLLSFVY